MIPRKDATTPRRKRKIYDQGLECADTANPAGRDYPNTLALKKGDVRSPELVFDFADVKVPNTAGGRAFCGPLLEQTLGKLE